MDIFSLTIYTLSQIRNHKDDSNVVHHVNLNQCCEFIIIHKMNKDSRLMVKYADARFVFISIDNCVRIKQLGSINYEVEYHFIEYQKFRNLLIYLFF